MNEGYNNWKRSQYCNAGGPMSRSRREVLFASVLGGGKSRAVSCPRVMPLALETLVDREEHPLDDFELETVGRSEEEFEFEDEGDSANTKLDLARAYIDMGDADGARDILNEVLDEGNTDQQQKAKAMLEAL